MTHEGTQGTPLDILQRLTPKQQCIADGGTWNEETKTCVLLKKEELEEEPPKVDPTIPEVFEIEGTAKQGITLPSGRRLTGLSRDDIAFIGRREAEKAAQPLGTVPAGTAQRRADIQFRGEQLAGQIGEFGQLPISPTGLKLGEAVTTGVVSSIPSALRLAVTGAGVGIVGGATIGALGGPIGAGAGAAIGAVAGFVGGISSGMISNFKSQRTDTTTAQQRILDEGKQTLMDWVTLARADPANRMFYLAQYNNQLAQIDQAFRQMKLDTSRDLAKFETALPNLAEFNTFYSIGGERDSLSQEMRNALLARPPEDYDFLELVDRRKSDEQES